MNMIKIKAFIVRMVVLLVPKLNQASTIKGVLAVITAVGAYTFTDVQVDTIIKGMAALYVLLSILISDTVAGTPGDNVVNRSK